MNSPQVTIGFLAGYTPIADTIFLKALSTHDAEIGLAQVFKIGNAERVSGLDTMPEGNARAVAIDLHSVGLFRESSIGSNIRGDADGDR